MIQEQLLKTIRKFKLIQKRDKVFVAVSGGGDSVVLFHLLREIAESWGLKLGVLHLNHKLRGRASDQDEMFVRHLAKRFNVPCYVTQVNVKEKAKVSKISTEEAARNVRYEFFEKIAKQKKVNAIALAHTQDDQAETVLMRLITGTGLQGLQATRPKRKLNGSFAVRPLIEISRRELREFAYEKSIKFREDASNQSKEFMRNRIRMELIPLIEKKFNPQVKKALARLPYLIDSDLELVEETAGDFYQKHAQLKNGEVSFPKNQFHRLKPAVQYRLIQRALRALSGAELDFEHWSSFQELFSNKDSFRLQFPKGVFAIVSKNQIQIKHVKSAAHFSYPFSKEKPVYIPELDATVSLEILKTKPADLKKKSSHFEILDASKLRLPLKVRNRKPGDRFQPLGMSKSFKLKEFLMNRNIPREERDFIPLVSSNGTIVWVAGLRLAEPFKITPETREFARLSLIPGKII